EGFHRLYPAAEITVSPASTRDAIVELLNDSVRLVIVDRPLNAEEIGVAEHYGMEVVQTRIGEDALAVIVNNRNPMENMTLTSLEKIIAGKASMWRQVPEAGWSGQIELCMTTRNSGTYELLVNNFFHLKEGIVAGASPENQKAVLRHVANHSQAIGFVSVACLNDTAGQPDMQAARSSVRVLAVESKDSASSSRFAKLHQANVYRGWYPLHFPVYLCTTAKRTTVAAGFSAFVASVPGQKIIQEAGLVPATMPVRLVQLTQEKR
ncbi:MAG: PstS family phosphate ABC transporter substrate-binding protein, partial [Terriglobia bacterium]